MSRIRATLWRLLYAVFLLAIFIFVVPFLFQLMGVPIPAGPAIVLMKYAVLLLIILFIFFGPEPYVPF